MGIFTDRLQSKQQSCQPRIMTPSFPPALVARHPAHTHRIYCRTLLSPFLHRSFDMYVASEYSLIARLGILDMDFSRSTIFTVVAITSIHTVVAEGFVTAHRTRRMSRLISEYTKALLEDGHYYRRDAHIVYMQCCPSRIHEAQQDTRAKAKH